MKQRKDVPQKIIILYAIIIFGLFLVIPMVAILGKSFLTDAGLTFEIYQRLLLEKNIGQAFLNSVVISSVSAFITNLFAFLIAYTINYTNLNPKMKKVISGLVMLPMLLPTITYGYALIYTFGKQGLLTKLLGVQLLDVYSAQGLIFGYIIYTLPISFMLINNAMNYVDKKFMVVSRLMGDSGWKTFRNTILRPLTANLFISFIQSFTLSFTDYGIPAALAGNIDLLSTRLYSVMLGSLPDFNVGSAISIIMLIPSLVSIALISYLQKFNIRYGKISQVELKKNKVRDEILGTLSMLIIVVVISMFGVIFIIPFVEQWPYRMSFTMGNLVEMFSDSVLLEVYKNSLFVAFMTAVFGTLLAYSTALFSARRGEHRRFGKIADSVSLITNAIPGMVLGVAYLLVFRGTALHNTFLILIVCDIIHYFSSPYLMMKGGLEKLNASWEVTAKLMGDTWLKTVLRIITPNVMKTILEVFEYYFVNAMVTVSAVIFLAGTKTMVVTAKIKELQHFAKFNEIFVLSILIFCTNLAVKTIVRIVGKKIGGK